MTPEFIVILAAIWLMSLAVVALVAFVVGFAIGQPDYREGL